MGPDTLGIFIPIIAVFMSLLIPIVYTITDYRRRRDIIEAHHKERLAAIERGTDIPPLPDSFYQPIQRRPPRGDSGLLPGLIWMFVGIGLFVALAAITGGDEGVQYFALIPAGVGLAYLIHYFVEGRKRPPQAPATPDEVTGSR
ncbi:MAG: DUF6249 domain-containing protein [Steroidobacteraceae bacterium]